MAEAEEENIVIQEESYNLLLYSMLDGIHSLDSLFPVHDDVWQSLHST